MEFLEISIDEKNLFIDLIDSEWHLMFFCDDS